MKWENDEDLTFLTFCNVMRIQQASANLAQKEKDYTNGIEQLDFYIGCKLIKTSTNINANILRQQQFQLVLNITAVVDSLYWYRYVKSALC